jgi:hypothetical protein
MAVEGRWRCSAEPDVVRDTPVMVDCAPIEPVATSVPAPTARVIAPPKTRISARMTPLPAGPPFMDSGVSQ